MKKLFLPFIFLLLTFPAISQGWVYIDGTITDIQDSLPVPNHPVTIMSDSSNGVFYYNVVLTDSSGHYYDDVPVMSDSAGILFVQTLDCNNNLLQSVIIYDPINNTFTEDFRICTLNTNCEANFSYSPEPQGSPDSFQFNDLSTGDIFSWLWNFGDGTISEEQDPLHTYPGPGTFEACLTITSNNCTDTYCETIVISDTVYQQLYGQVFAGNFPEQSATVMLYALNPGGGYTPLDALSVVDSNGIYYFTLVPSGIYLIQAVPSANVSYLPTYYGDAINWQQAAQVNPGETVTIYNINLVPAGPMTPGPGSVSGQVNTGKDDRSAVDKINMLLMNDSLTAISFSEVSPSGYFDFPTLDYGTYYLRADLSGVASDNMKIEISPENPHLDIILNYSGNSVLDVEEKELPAEEVSVYPNPVADRLTVSCNLAGPTSLEIEIYSLTGRLVYRAMESGNTGLNTLSIPLNDYPAGLYTLRIYSDNGIYFVKKILIVSRG